MLPVCSICTKAQTVSVADFGLKPDTRENAVPYVRRALEHCRENGISTLRFPEGRYDFWPHHCIERDYFESNTTDNNPKRLAILIEKFDGLTIDGGGSDFVFHDRMQPFTVDSSANITVKNLSVDWDIPLTAQAVVLRATDSCVDLQINAYESPYIIENGRLVFVGEGWKSAWNGTMEFDRNKRIVVPRTGDRGCMNAAGEMRAEELSKGVVRIHAGYKRTPAAGNLLVLRHSERDHAGIFITGSKNVALENLNVYHCAGLGILAQYSENLAFTNVNNIPNEKKGRILAGHDDGFQISNCRGDVSMKNCIFHALMDDPVNVHGTSVRIVERLNDRTLRCKFMHGQSSGMIWARTGESVGFIDNKNMQTVAFGTVSSYRQTAKDVFEISFTQPVPGQITEGYALENLTWTCNFSVTGSQFRSCRARGLLVSTPGKVTVTGNVFESSGSAILIAGDANGWFESGAVKDVTITRNTFKSPCMTSMYQFCEGVISIFPIIPQKDRATPFHRNIRIVDNSFELFDYPILYALSVDGIEFSNNRLVRSHDFEPFHHRKHGLTFEYCKRITVKGNTVEGEVPGNTVQLVQTPQKEYKTDKKQSFFQLKITD
ncbi:MAG: right-handed parallel beta-helix repeat-containing protein [Prevotellaceae bacterium]|nr:right-handed parallel beta-helix repeat-containing protein [Prevotellaceae bacterium]